MRTGIVVWIMSALLAGPAQAQEQCFELFAELEIDYKVDRFQSLLLEEILVRGELPRRSSLPEIFAEAGKRSDQVLFEQIFESEAHYKEFLDQLLLGQTSLLEFVRQHSAHPVIVEFKAKATPRLRKSMFRHFQVNLVAPTDADIGRFLGVSQSLTETLYPSEELKDLWQQSLEENNGDLQKVRRKLVRAVFHEMTQRGSITDAKTVAVTPTPERLLKRLTEAYSELALGAEAGSFTQNDLEVLVGLRKQGQRRYPVPVLFATVDELMDATYAAHPSSMAGYKSSYFSMAYSEETLALLKQQNRFIAFSITAGQPLEEDFVHSVLNYAERNDAYVLVGLVNREFMAVPDLLRDHPRVRIVTHTFDLGPEFAISDMPIGAKNMNPAASLDKFSVNERGQTQLLFHTQMRMLGVPTTENHIAPMALWFTGTGNIRAMPYKRPISGRTSRIARDRMIQSAVILEKSDAQSGMLGRGAPGKWHLRPAIYVDDRELGGKAGFTDLGVRYQPDGEVSRNRVEVMGIGDLHDRYADQRMLAAIREQFLQKDVMGESLLMEGSDILVHDGLDGDYANHHEMWDRSHQMRKAETGRLSGFDEFNQYLSTLNGLQRLTEGLDTHLVFPDANHNYWPKYLAEAMPRDPVNQRLLDEVREKATTHGLSVFEYLLTRRHEYLQNIDDPAVRLSLGYQQVMPYDKERMQILNSGQTYSRGPTHRRNEYGHHGHKGRNGAKGSPETHAAGVSGGMIGDSHQPGIIVSNGPNGQIMANLGVASYLRRGYNEGGYSSWGNAVALQFEDGTIQLVIYESTVGSFYADHDAGVLSSDEFFTREPKVVLDDNEISSGNVTDQWTHVPKR